jgi:hypothetical protein
MKYLILMMFFVFSTVSHTVANDTVGLKDTTKIKIGKLDIEKLKKQGYFNQPPSDFFGKVKFYTKYFYNHNKWMFFGACILLVGFIYRCLNFFTKK